jgi:Protein of unknown function (DUF3667)
VSHQPERKEKNCLNCGTIVAGRYCQVCGQENVVSKQSFGSLVRHFIFDIFHFDGKFFDTVKFLLFRPGKVPKQYVSGKRVSYLDPIRMYLFTSAIFFLAFFSMGNGTEEPDENNRSMTERERLEYASFLNKKSSDSAAKRQLNFLLDTAYTMNLMDPVSGATSDSSFLIGIKGRQYLMVAEKNESIDTIKIGTTIYGKKLGENFIITRNGEEIDSGTFVKNGFDSFRHKLPYLLFVSLPFFALILKLLYRRRKEFFYSDHAVFTLYHYIFTFLLLLVMMMIAKIGDAVHWKFFDTLQLVLFFCGGLYLYIAMQRFYGQRWGKTLVKFLLLNVLGFFMALILFLIFLIYSFFQQ